MSARRSIPGCGDRRLAAAFALVAAGALLALAPAAARAAPGDLTQVGCIANFNFDPCVQAPNDSLSGAIGVAVSPDGRDVYAVAQVADAINHLTRASDGSLTYVGCISNAGTGGDCVNPVRDPLNGAFDVIPSPDGLDVYASASGQNSAIHLDRLGDGSLSMAECWNEPMTGGCSGPAFSPLLDGARGLAIRPDGAFVFMAAPDADRVVVFPRFEVGQLNSPGCFAENDGDPLPNCQGGTLDGAAGIAVSPDGAHAYVASATDSSVSRFNIAGSLPFRFIDCVANAGGSGCTNPPLDSLFGARGIAVSPDGGDVYVVSQSALTHFDRGADGSLSEIGCHEDSGLFGCVDMPGDSLSVGEKVLVSPDGRNVYVTASSSAAVNVFDRAANGSLTFRNCIANGGGDGCLDPAIDSLSGATGLATSPDGSSIYVASHFDASVTHFRRELPPAAPAVTTSSGAGKCAGKTATEVGTAKGETLRGTGKRDVIAALGGNDRVLGLSGMDLLCGGSGKDTMLGAGGADTLLGEGAKDRLNGGAGPDTLKGGAKRDVLKGAGGRDVCVGGAGPDQATCERERAI